MPGYSELEQIRFKDGAMQGAWWQHNSAGRIDCQLCPRKCSLKPGDKGFCFVRENRDGDMALTTYGKSTGFCIDPIEKKPLNHFYPGTPVLSFGTAGCNLGCKFCQNWDISKSREVERLSATAEPEAIARAAVEAECTSVAYTYNDPIIWAEYAIDTAKACRQAGVKNVAVTAGYITAEARGEFFEFMDAANVDLKAFTEDFYHKVTYSHLEPVLDTLRFLKHETEVWFEITNLLIPDANDNPGDLRRMCDWILKSLDDEVPIHFTAFHPDFRMTDRSRTSPDTLAKAREIAQTCGLKYVYVGNVHDVTRQSTFCPNCNQVLIERDWYQLGRYNIDVAGRCNSCQTSISGRFGTTKGEWGSKRQPIRISDYSVDSRQIYNIEGQAKKGLSVTGANQEAQDANSMNTSTARPTPVAQPQLLDIAKIPGKSQTAILQSAGKWVAQAVHEETPGAPQEFLGELANQIVMGAFVTLKRGEILRGCCGVLGKPMRLGEAIASAAAKTATEDQRMAAIAPNELPHLHLDVTLLGPFNRAEGEGAARADGIEIGKHGLMIQHAGKSGLLLPSVATERGWNATEFLHAVCNKAGLPTSAWQSSDAQVLTFDGECMGADMAEFLPVNLTNERPMPLNKEQLSEYARIAGENIVALVTGGTPSYVIPQLPDATVNAIVLSMQWGPTDDPSQLRQGNALQVSFRPGVAMQSTLYQMCQRAAQMFQQQRFTGQLQIGLTVGFAPAMHGYGLKADLNGVDPTARAIVISDQRHCGLVFHPEKTPDEMRQTLREVLPITTRDSALHTLQVVSTMPQVLSISAPTPTLASGMRPTAVAGKFYPGEDAARRAMVGTMFKGLSQEKSNPAAIMVPHAGIKYSGKIAAQVWDALEAPESRPIIIISPKHTANGVNWAVCPYESWQVSKTTTIQGDANLAKQIADAVTPLQLDASAHLQEHGIEVQLPFLERVAPNATVVGLTLHGGSWDDISSAAQEFATFLKSLPQTPLLVISSDMNHYASEEENQRRDRLALDALSTADPQQLIDTCRDNEISMCGVVPAAFVIETLRQMGESISVTELGYTTSAEVTGDKSQVVGYAGALLSTS